MIVLLFFYLIPFFHVHGKEETFYGLTDQTH